MTKRLTILALVLLVPLSMIAAAAYEIASGKNRPVLYLLVVAIPGALLAALKELKDSGLLAPAILKINVDGTRARVARWQQATMGGNVIRDVTDIVIPIRLENIDLHNALQVLDVSIASVSNEAQLEIPPMTEVQLGSERKWIYPFVESGYTGLFNDTRQKTIEAKGISDFVIGVCEYDRTHAEYNIRITFRDNWNRTYTRDVTIAAP